jgi:acetolactate synthase I/II/III large subunit
MPEMSGSRFFAETVQGYGVSHLFFVPTILTPALAAMEGMPITRVMTHGEKAAAYMADGYARAAGRPGICMAQTVGAANLAAGLKDALMARSPVIAISGGPTAETRYRYAYQEINDFPLFGPVTKFSARVDAVERFPDLLRQAFRVATSGAPGPVHLELPGEQGQAVDRTADLEVIVEETFKQVPAFRPEPEMERVRAAARALAEARRPIIVAGGGVSASQATAEVVELAEKLSIPVATSLNAKGTIPDDHPLAVGVVGTYSRSCANRAVAEADLVFFIGSHTGGQVTHFWKIPPRGTPVIQLDIDPQELGRNYPNAVSLMGDARVTLRRLIEVAERGASRTEWTERAQTLVREWRAEVAPFLSSDAVPMRPERICKELAEFLPPDAVVVCDTGHAGMWTGQVLDLKHLSQRYIRAAGSLGWGFPASLGVKSALPERPVLCFTGDGGFYYHVAELETAARYGINVVVLVNDNQSMNQEIRPFNAAYGGRQDSGFEMWNFEKTDFVKLAESMGCLGLRVERPDGLRGALERAFAAERPVVLDVVSDINALAPRAWS